MLCVRTSILSARLKQLAVLLDISQGHAAALVLTQPELLVMDRRAIAAVINALAIALSVSGAEI